MAKQTHAHITFKVPRPKNPEQEAKLQLKLLKTVSDIFGDNRIPFGNPKTAEMSGTLTIFDEADLSMFTINVYIPLDSKSKEEIENMAGDCMNRIRSAKNVKSAICYNSDPRLTSKK